MDLERIEKLIRLLGQSHVRELIVEADGWHVLARRSQSTSPAGASASSETGPSDEYATGYEEEQTTATITAPWVGIFRQGIARLETGSRIEAGEPVGSIESMKILNPVISPITGQILEVIADDGHPVEYGQALFLVEMEPEDLMEGIG